MREGVDARVSATLAMFLGLSALGLVGLLLPLPESTLALRWLLNMAHVPLFATWTFLLLTLWLSAIGARGALWTVGTVGLLVALGSENLQSLQPTRRVDPLDAFSNVAGVGLGLAYGRWRWRTRFANL